MDSCGADQAIRHAGPLQLGTRTLVHALVRLAVFCSSARLTRSDLQGFPRLFQCFSVHEKLLQRYLPALHAHFVLFATRKLPFAWLINHPSCSDTFVNVNRDGQAKAGIETAMYATKWYMDIFLGALPFPVVLRYAFSFQYFFIFFFFFFLLLLLRLTPQTVAGCGICTCGADPTWCTDSRCRC